MSTTPQPQAALDERELGNADLEAALEEREKRKASLAAVKLKFAEADEAVRGMLAEFQLADGEVARCGRFRIEKRSTPGGYVSFERSPSSRTTIAPLDTE